MSGRGAGPGSPPALPVLRPARVQDAADAAAVSRMVAAYLLQTEAEKGAPVARASALPERYRHEVEQPVQAFAGTRVLLAEVDGAIAGMVLLTAPKQGRCEIKRLWTEPWTRGRGVGRALVDACVDQACARGDATVELTVWRWRAAAIALYLHAGFERVESWDPRPALVCLRRDL